MTVLLSILPTLSLNSTVIAELSETNVGLRKHGYRNEKILIFAKLKTMAQK